MTRSTNFAENTGYLSLQHFIRLISAAAVIFLVMQILISFATAGQVNLTWDASTDSSIIGYKLYFGTSSGVYTQVADAGYTTSYTVTGLDDTQSHYFAVTAYDLSNNESGYSNEVSRAAYGNPNPLPDGDVNGDRAVDLQDSLLALRIATGLLPVTDDHLVRADVAPLVDGRPAPDRQIDMADALLILRKAVGLINW